MNELEQLEEYVTGLLRSCDSFGGNIKVVLRKADDSPVGLVLATEEVDLIQAIEKLMAAWEDDDATGVTITWEATEETGGGK